MIREQSNKNSEDDLDERLQKNVNGQSYSTTNRRFQRNVETSVRTIIQNNKGPKCNTEVQIRPLVDKTTDRTEKKHELRKYQITRNNAEQREKNKATYLDQ